jgi:hypothetical protein
VGDGNTLDTAAIQRAIDAAAAAGGGQVLIRGGKKYLVSTLKLRSGIDFHLADDAELLVSTKKSDYPADADGILTATNAENLKFSGTGNINGRALEFMTGFDKEGEIWQIWPVPSKDLPADKLPGCGGPWHQLRPGAVLGASYAGLRARAGGWPQNP